MAQNESIIASLEAQSVPSDRECVRTLSEILQGVQDFVLIAGLASAASGSGLPSTNNTAAQALSTANSALAIAQTVQTSIKERRSNGTMNTLPTGDSTAPLTWSPVMPDTNYEVRVTIVGAIGHPAAYYGWRVVNGSQTTGSCTVSFDNMPAGSFYTYVIEQL